jgi:UDPglucose 6-dehydrogenase
VRVAVIGLGKLGLPLAALLANSNNKVKGFDLSETLRNSLTSKTFKSPEPGLADLLTSSSSTFEIANSVAETVSDSEVVFIIVPTPSESSGRFSNNYLVDALREIGKSVSQSNDKIVIDVVSTVMPQSCSGVLKKTLEESSGREVGESLGLCYNPEFIALGSVIHDMEYPDMHLIGQSSEWAGEYVERALKTITKIDVPTRRMSLTEAELVKIAVNNFVTMKISYANMLYQAALTLGDVDIDVVTSAIGLDSRIGGKYLRAAAPYGGPCFPRDTRALSNLYDELGLIDSLSTATDLANKNHVKFIADLIDKNFTGIKTVGIAGISYKTGTQVVEESPGLAVADYLESLGHKIRYWDDENAQPDKLTAHLIACDSAETLVVDSDFILISRPLNDPASFYRLLEKSNKPYFDLWRQK